MSDFPLLKTGAVTQYPSSRQLLFSTRVLTFADGGEQRFRQAAGAVRRWIIRLSDVTEDEFQSMKEFFRAQGGRLESFAFTDPWTGSEHADCSLESDALELDLRDEDRGRTTLIIRENRT